MVKKVISSRSILGSKYKVRSKKRPQTRAKTIQGTKNPQWVPMKRR